jgi:hypothetical protein
MRRRLAIAVSAMLLGAQIGSPVAAEEPSVEDLTTISQLIEAGDLEALILFLSENPHLMEGDSLIARRLREFMAAAQDVATYLAFDPPIRRAIARQLFDEGSSFMREVASVDSPDLEEVPAVTYPVAGEDSSLY